MPIRSSIAAKSALVSRIPWELEYALRLINNGYEYGNERTTIDTLMQDAVEWSAAARQATFHGRTAYGDLCLSHSNLCFRAAALLEAHDGAKR